MTAWARIVSQGFYTPTGALALEPPGKSPLPASLGLLPRNLRRGISPLTRSVLAAAEGALAGVPEGAPVPAVFASRYGEIQTAVELMRRAQEQNESSPARFRHSVQNTCLGLLSLARRDAAPNTALSAGEDTLAMALLEGFMLLAQGASRVLVAVADEPVPEELGENPLGGGGAAAWLLEGVSGSRVTGPEDAEGHGLWLTRPGRSSDAAPCHAQPLAAALALVERVKSQRPGAVTVGNGGGRPWLTTLAVRPEEELSR